MLQRGSTLSDLRATVNHSRPCLGQSIASTSTVVSGLYSVLQDLRFLVLRNMLADIPPSSLPDTSHHLQTPSLSIEILNPIDELVLWEQALLTAAKL